MNIAFLIDKLSLGGTQRQLILLANRLAERQEGKILVVCLQRRGELAAELSERIELVDLGLDRVYGLRAAAQLLRLRTLLRRWRCQVLHTFLPSANIFGALLGTLSGIPTVVSRRDVGIYPNRHWQRLEEKVGFRLASRIVCVSREVTELLLAREPALAAKTRFVPNAVELKAPGAEEPPVQGGYIVTVGRVTAVKGFDLLLEAAAEINGIFVVVGAGEDLDQLQDETRTRGVQDKVRFVGQKDPHQVAALVSRASFAVHPSRSEGMSNAILEYMAYGNAVVCRDLSGNRELISHGGTGFLFRERSDFIACVNTLLADRALCAAMAQRARDFVKQRHSVDAVLASYGELYQGLARAGR